MNGPRRLRLCYFNTWANGLETAASYLGRVSRLDIRARVSDPSDPRLLAMARLDCDWYAENARCVAQVSVPSRKSLPAFVSGIAGLVEFAGKPADGPEDRWLIFSGHQPQALGKVAGKVLALLAAAGVRVLYYAFDEASRHMSCFRDIAPYLAALIHDEEPLDPLGRSLLPAGCVCVHRSWVANVVPFSSPFVPEPDRRILFLGSELGLTAHRKRQIAFLQQRFRDRFVAIHDHSVSIPERAALGRFKVGLCPEGRKFTTPAMRRTHTDRPFWSGCLGMVPVAEDSVPGGRLDDLANGGLIVRYAHGDLEALAQACERGLDASEADRRRIYEHFNRHETIGTAVADAIAACRE